MDLLQLRSILESLVVGLKDAGTDDALPSICEKLGLPAPGEGRAGHEPAGPAPGPYVVGLLSDMTNLNRKAEKIIVQWLEDSADIKAADTTERQSKGKPNVMAADLFAECGL